MADWAQFEVWKIFQILRIFKKPWLCTVKLIVVLLQKENDQFPTICDSSVGLVDSSKADGHEFKPHWGYELFFSFSFVFERRLHSLKILAFRLFGKI